MSFRVTEEPLRVGELAAVLRHDRAGARVSFEGVVRDHHLGHAVDHLEYEAFAEMVEAEGGRILEEARGRFALTDAAAVHRTGRLEVGDVAVWVGTLAEHRQEAFLACRWIMDEIKKRLPVWKKERFADGRVEWVGAGGESPEADAPSDYYRRQICLPQLGEEGQERLNAARVLVIGAGGLGCPALQYLAAAGVGALTICDGDRVSLSNLHRQILFTPGDVGHGKAAVAAERLRGLNPWIRVRGVDEYVTEERMEELMGEQDVVLDCTDNFDTRYLVHDACWEAGVPLVQAAIHQFEGYVQTFRRGSEGGCYRCLWQKAPAAGCVGNCAEAGVLGATAGLVGVYQAMEALKLLLDWPDRLEAETLLFDLMSGETRRIRRSARADCCCATREPFPRDPFRGRILRAGSRAEALIRKGVCIDLREPEEREGNPERILALPSFPRERWGEILECHPERPIILCCAAGIRSRTCLERMGFPAGVYTWSERIFDLPE